MGAPTVYRSDDPGAPVWNNQNGFVDVLKACLVNGYPGRAAAGWSVLYDDFATSGNLSLTNSAGSGVLGVYHPLTSGLLQRSPIIYCAEAMQDASHPVNGRSYLNGFADTAAIPFGTNDWHYTGLYRQDYGTDWVVIASENFCVMFYCANTGASLLFGSPQSHFFAGTYSPLMLGFGAIDSVIGLGGGESAVLQGNFYVVGGARGQGSANPISSFSPFSYLESDSLDGNLANLHAHLFPFAGVASHTMLAGAPMVRVGLMARGSVSYSGVAPQLGYIPGVYTPLGVSSMSSQYYVNRYMPPAPIESFKTVIEVGGKSFICGITNNSDPVFISLGAEDW